jgi:hypothetical protein
MNILQELLALREAKGGAKPDFLHDDDTPIGQLERLAQPIGINGGSYTYWVDVTKTPLKFTASDGSEIDKAKTLEDIAKWMDKWAAKLWLEFLNGDEDLEGLRAENIVRLKSKRTDQAEHEQNMREAVEPTELAGLEAKMIDAVLPRIKANIEDHHNDIDQIVTSGSIDDYVYDAFKTLVKMDDWTGAHDKLEKKLNKMSVSAWKAAFKAKYNTTDSEIIKGLVKEGEKKFSPEEQKFVKELTRRFTYRITIKDFDKSDEYHLRWYMKSPDKLVIVHPDIVGQIFTDKGLAADGMSIEKVKAMFERFGIKQSKRPVQKRSAPSYYD